MTLIKVSDVIPLTLYAIRHKATRELMPQLKGRKGYSHWNPAVNKKTELKVTSAPRLFQSEKIARMVITQWFCNPNAEMRGYITASGEDDYDIQTKPDGRTKEDLEMIAVRLEIPV